MTGRYSQRLALGRWLGLAFVSKSFLLSISTNSNSGNITGDNDLDMAWEKYEEKIVQRYKVSLKGWPSGVGFNIHKLGTGDLTLCFRALTAKPPTIFWAKLTDEELEERRRTVTKSSKTRKQRSDKGVKRTKRKRGTDEDEDDENPISPETVDDSD